MPKVLGKVGASLADVYDVEGSIAGVENLDSDSVGLVHEMGATIFAERISGDVARLFFDGIAQNVTLGASFPGLPQTPFRIGALSVLVDTVARLTRLVISLSELDPGGAAIQETPIWAWDDTLGTSTTVRVIDGGAAAANFAMLIPEVDTLPQLLMGAISQQGVVNGLTARGLTAGFGAGTVDIIALAYILSAPAAGSGISSLGLPIPSW